MPIDMHFVSIHCCVVMQIKLRHFFGGGSAPRQFRDAKILRFRNPSIFRDLRITLVLTIMNQSIGFNQNICHRVWE